MAVVDEARLRSTTDAWVWAEEFAKVCPDVDLGLMVGWFANAIETAKQSVGVVDAMRQAGWTEYMIGAAMDAKNGVR